jgi:hypothetical protein
MFSKVSENVRELLFPFRSSEPFLPFSCVLF